VHTGEKFDLDSWFSNLKAGHTFVSNGPALLFTVDDELPGSELKRAPGARLNLRARALGHERIGLPAVLQIEGPDGVVKEVKNRAAESELSVDLEYVAERSQWLLANVVCDNQSVAHTTPVYIVVNEQPTWNPRQGPALIDKQLTLMVQIESEFAKGNDARSVGIRERLQKAKLFNADLREKMRASNL
jgi:hypothetical protein